MINRKYIEGDTYRCANGEHILIKPDNNNEWNVYITKRGGERRVIPNKGDILDKVNEGRLFKLPYGYIGRQKGSILDTSKELTR